MCVKGYKTNQDVFYFAQSEKEYTGCASEGVSFFEREQFFDVTLWKSFVQQFRDQLDGENQGWRGEYWGKIMRGAVMVYEYSQNQELFKILTETVEDMLSVAEYDGRVSSFSRETEFDAWDLWCRKYVLLGMEYYYEICPDEKLKKRILYFLCGCVDYIIKFIGKESWKKRITLASRSWLGINSSSILEPIVKLYTLTDDIAYLDFATYIVENGGAEGINIFELAYENLLYPYQYGVSKAYEMISCFEGLIEYYEVTGIEKYKTAAVNFGKAVLKSDVSVIGTCGCTHELFDHSKNRQTAHYEGIMQETCVTVTWMKYCGRLLRLTGDRIFADCMEQSFYNAYLGTLNTEHRDCPYIREKFVERLKAPHLKYTFLPVDSYSPLTSGKRGQKVGGTQMLGDGSYYGCCTAIAAAGVGTYLKHSVMISDRGIVINFFENGTASLFYCGKKITLKMETAYPMDGKIRMTVHTDEPISCALMIRVPHWSAQTAVISDKDYVLRDGFAVLEGIWNGDSKIELNLDMRIRTVKPIQWDTDVIYTNMNDLKPGSHVATAMQVRHRDEDDRYISLSRGPLTLAADSRMGKDAASMFSFRNENGNIVHRVCDVNEIVPGKTSLIKCEFYSESGEIFYLIDYASAGRDWKTEIAAWLPNEQDI